MKVSMNGLRKNLSDEVRGYVGSLNCIYDPNDEDFAEIEIELP